MEARVRKMCAPLFSYVKIRSVTQEISFHVTPPSVDLEMGE